MKTFFLPAFTFLITGAFRTACFGFLFGFAGTAVGFALEAGVFTGVPEVFCVGVGIGVGVVFGAGVGGGVTGGIGVGFGVGITRFPGTFPTFTSV